MYSWCCLVRSVCYQFWEVVPVEDLLVRMELDSAPVAKRITSLLLDSFQPLDKGRQEQVCSAGEEYDKSVVPPSVAVLVTCVRPLSLLGSWNAALL